MNQQLDWNTQITRAEQKGKFNPDDKTLSGDWKLCKASETLPLKDDFGDILNNPNKEIASSDIYNKYSPVIEDLGYMFAQAMKTDDSITAKDLDNSSELYIRLHKKKEPYTEEHSLKLPKQMFSRWYDV